MSKTKIFTTTALTTLIAISGAPEIAISVVRAVVVNILVFDIIILVKLLICK